MGERVGGKQTESVHGKKRHWRTLVGKNIDRVGVRDRDREDWL